MKENKLLKMQSLVILTVMILHILVPVFPLNTISNAEEIEEETTGISGNGTQSKPWKIGKNKDENVIAYVNENNVLKIQKADGATDGEMMDFEYNTNQWGDKTEKINSVIIGTRSIVNRR